MKHIKCELIIHGHSSQYSLGNFDSIKAAKQYIKDCNIMQPHTIMRIAPTVQPKRYFSVLWKNMSGVDDRIYQLVRESKDYYFFKEDLGTFRIHKRTLNVKHFTETYNYNGVRAQFVEEVCTITDENVVEMQKKYGNSNMLDIIFNEMDDMNM